MFFSALSTLNKQQPTKDVSNCVFDKIKKNKSVFKDILVCLMTAGCRPGQVVINDEKEPLSRVCIPSRKEA